MRETSVRDRGKGSTVTDCSQNCASKLNLLECVQQCACQAAQGSMASASSPPHSLFKALQHRVGECEGALCIVRILNVHLQTLKSTDWSTKRLDRSVHYSRTAATVLDRWPLLSWLLLPPPPTPPKAHPRVHEDLDCHQRLSPLGQVDCKGRRKGCRE